MTDSAKHPDPATEPESEIPAADTQSDEVSTPSEESSDSEANEGKSETEKWRELALRSQADLENYRKRMAREKSEAIQYANASLLSSLLPVLDNFEMGLMAAKQEGEGNIIYQGFLMVRKQIEDFLAENGVLPVEASGPFNPNVHEAVQQEHHDTVPEGDIIAELRRGYRLNERLLRAANVTVSKGPGESDA